MRKITYFYAALITIIFGACNGTANKDNQNGKSPQKDSVKAGTEIKFDRKYDDLARYLSGLPSIKGSLYEAEDNSAFFKEHSSKFGERWKEMDEKRLSKMRSWANQELYEKLDEELPTFYPFSGPDFLHCWQFFPKSKKYLFLAQELVGFIPDLSKKSTKERESYLKSVEKALGDIFKRSYFITGRMMSDIPKLEGTIPVFMVFLARTENEIVNIELIELNKEGKVNMREPHSKGGIKGVRFTFRPRNNKKDLRTLEYFSCNLADDGIVKTPELIGYIENFGKSNVFIKSASYLLHYNTFSKAREAILKTNASVLEDDTGIPYRFFHDKGYDEYLYGVYVKPVNEFKGVEQKDLAKAFKESSKVKPLPFSLGYHWYTNDQNYMLYIKK